MKVTQEGVHSFLLLQSLFEGLMFVVSVYLAFKHVKAAKAVSDVTYFHIVHGTYCLVATVKEATFYNISIDDCIGMSRSVFATLPQHILLTATFAVFFQHW